MNIFVVDENPCRAAEALCDKHVGKMLMESCQLLATSLWQAQGVTSRKQFEAMEEREQQLIMLRAFNTYPAGLRPYWPTHANHPCSIWLRESAYNYDWLADHALALADQFRQRRGKTHACEAHARWLANAQPVFMMRDWQYYNTVRTPFAQAVHESCICGDAVEAYRAYYNRFKTHIASWNWGVPAPVWWAPELAPNHTT